MLFHHKNKSDVVSVITICQTTVSDLPMLQAGQHQVPSALWRACSEQTPCYAHIISSKSCPASQARGPCSASGSSERCRSSNCSSRRWQVFFYLSCAALLATFFVGAEDIPSLFKLKWTVLPAAVPGMTMPTSFYWRTKQARACNSEIPKIARHLSWGLPSTSKASNS